jgi:hypothetical protein
MNCLQFATYESSAAQTLNILAMDSKLKAIGLLEGMYNLSEREDKYSDLGLLLYQTPNLEGLMIRGNQLAAPFPSLNTAT